MRYCSFSIVTECKSFAIVITNCNEINFQIIMNKSFQNYKYIKFMHQKKMTYSISVCNYCLYFDTINYLFSLKSLFQLFVSNIYAENSALSWMLRYMQYVLTILKFYFENIYRFLISKLWNCRGGSSINFLRLIEFLFRPLKVILI